MTNSFFNSAGTAIADHVDPFVNPPFINAQRAPTSQDLLYPGTRWMDSSVNPPIIYSTSGAGNWDVGGVEPATTTTFGTVQLATLAELQGGSAPAGAYVPTANDVATVIAGVVVGAVPGATTAQQGIVELATNAEVISPWTPVIPNTAITPSNIQTMFASPPAIGGTSAAAGSFTNLAASGTLGVTGASTIADLSATNGTFSGTLGVTGTSTLGVVGSGNTTITGTLGVSGTSTLATVNATIGTFSGTLGVTGTSTLGVVSSGNTTITGTLGVSGASSFSSATFSTTVNVTALTTLAATTIVGTTLINNSGAAATTIGGASAGAIGIVVGSGGNFSMTTATAAATMSFGSAAQTGLLTFGLSTAGQNISVGDGINVGAQVISIGNGASGANSTVNILSGIGTAGAGTLALGNNTRVTVAGLADIAPAASRTVTVGGGTITTAITDTIDIAPDGATTSASAVKTLNLNSGGVTLGSILTNIATGAVTSGTHTTAIATGNRAAGTMAVNLLTGTGVKTLNIGNADTLTVVNVASKLNLTSAATQLTVKGGAATDFIGTATLIGGTATILNTNIAAGDRIQITRSALNASPALGFLIYTITPTTSFIVESFSAAGAAVATDVSSFTYVITRQT